MMGYMSAKTLRERGWGVGWVRKANKEASREKRRGRELRARWTESLLSGALSALLPLRYVYTPLPR